MTRDLTNSDVATADLETSSIVTTVALTDPERLHFIGQRSSWRKRIAVPIAGILIALSPATVLPDFWYIEGRRRDVVTASWLVEAAIGMRISRIEALNIARQILERAEEGRLELAQWEALRGIQWGEDE